MKNSRAAVAANIIAVVGVVAVLLFGGFLALSNNNLERRLEVANDNSKKLYEQLITAGIAPVAPSTPAKDGTSIVGDTGPRGVPGRDGFDGINGATGAPGTTGAVGAAGQDGIGTSGATGTAGVPGKDGTNGTNGIDGTPGAIPQSITIIAPSGTIYVCTPSTPAVPTYTCIVQVVPPAN